ncbi:hypothetical protein [Rhizobium sp.]|uniref:hypothetical protein n=1 Tax=Rhizobium sp. TaxID=391 RepID=UPI0028AD5C72
MRKHFNFCLLLASALLALNGCSGEGDQQRTLMRGILSWTASAEMIAKARLRGDVPNGYSGLALSRCEEEVATLVGQVTEGAPALYQLPAKLKEAAAAVASGNKQAAEQSVAALHQARSNIQRETAGS